MKQTANHAKPSMCLFLKIMVLIKQKLDGWCISTTTNNFSNIRCILKLQGVAMEHGLILVDTKYEFGKASDGTIMSIDEVKILLFLTDSSLLYINTHSQILALKESHSFYRPLLFRCIHLT